MNTVKIEKADRKIALELLGVKGPASDNMVALFDKYEPLLLDKLTPCYVYKAFPIDENFSGGTIGAILQGEDIKKHMANCKKIILFAATLGFSPDGLITMATVSRNTTKALIVDALASAVIEQVCDMVESQISANKKTTTRYSPGYGDFPLTVQNDLLAALDAKKQIGVHVTEEGLLIPRKSVTAAVGVYS